MKLLFLTAIFAVVSSNPYSEEQKWPWKVGKIYRYTAASTTWAKFEEGIARGNAFNAQFTIIVKAPGHLLAKLENPLYSPVKEELHYFQDKHTKLNYQPVKDLEQTFEIFVVGGRIVSINLPPAFPVVHENFLKGLIGALQADLSTLDHMDYPNNFDKKSFQGLFKKMEADVTGNCETLYTVSPMSAEWRREVPNFNSEENPIAIIRSKDFDVCQERIDYQFGTPENIYYKGPDKFITHTYEARMIAGKQGSIYKSEVVSSVYASPFMSGKQKAEVYSYVVMHLDSIEDDNKDEWEELKEFRSINSLLFTHDNTMRPYLYSSDGIVARAEKVLEYAAPMLQNPNSLPKKDFVLQFNMLVFCLASMNSDQLSQMTSRVEIASSKNIAKYNMWIIYRDSVAQAGTAAAYEQIKSWVLSKKIVGEEAAEVVSAIGATLANPTKELSKDFFQFATNPEVTSQKYLNTSALLAVTKLLRYSKEDTFIVEDVIPYLDKELKQAVDEGKKSLPQVYIIVLGNLAHPEILKVFAPYLEGQVKVSKYLRIQMITNLKTLANLRNTYVRDVLYSILVNTAEPYEARVAAALNIFLAFPTQEMTQIMAHMTHEDPSTQVRAVLVNSINFAAGLKDPRYAKLANAAKSVLSAVAKENYGYRYSTEILFDGYKNDEELSYFREISFIGSENNMWPKYLRSAFRFRNTGSVDESQITLSISDVQHIINNYLDPKYYMKSPRDTNIKFPAKRITKILNIKHEPQEPLEAAIFVESLNQQKLLTFDQEELGAFIVGVCNNLRQIFPGIKPKFTHYTKLLTSKQVYIAFPLAGGMCFMFQYSEPLVIQAQMEANLVLNIIKNLKEAPVEVKSELTYARNLDGTVGFLDTFGDVFAFANVVNKFQIHIPLKITTKRSRDKTGKTKPKMRMYIEPSYTDKDINILHFSVIPFTGAQKRNSISFEVDLIKRPKKTLSTDMTFGNLTGTLFHLTASSSSADFNNLDPLSWSAGDVLTNIGDLLYQKDIALTEFNLKYLATEATTKSTSLFLYLEKFYNKKNSGEMGPATTTENLVPDSEPRRTELVKKVSSGMESPIVNLIDFGARFNGPKPVEYVFTAASAHSFVDPKIQAAFIAHSSKQISGVLKINIHPTKIEPLNFKEALKNKIELTYELDILNLNNLNIHVHGVAQRTNNYAMMLKNDPKGMKCLESVDKGNFYQDDCHSMIIKAHAPDFFETTVTFQDAQSLDSMVMFLKQQGVNLGDTKPVSGQTTVSLVGQASYYDNVLNYKFTSKFEPIFTDNVATLKYLSYPYVTAVYSPITSYERLWNWLTNYQHLPYCTVDDNQVRTFSSRSYNYTLSDAWHVVMLDQRSGDHDNDDLVILARRPAENQEEVYVSYKSSTGYYVELEIKPDSVSVKTNSLESGDGALTMYWDEFEKVPLLEYYTLVEGVQVFNLRNSRIRVIYDRHRLVLFTDYHRTTTKGICGQSTTQTRDDYMTPWGLVDQPEYYGASYALDIQFYNPDTLELKRQAQLNAYQPMVKYTKIIRSDDDLKKSVNKTFL